MEWLQQQVVCLGLSWKPPWLLSCSLHQAGNAEGRFWWLGVHPAALPEPFPAAHSHGHLLFCWDISSLPQSQGKETSPSVATSIGVTSPLSWPCAQGTAHGAKYDLWELFWLPRLRQAQPSPRDQAQVPQPLKKGLAKSQLCDLPAWNLLVTAWERKEAIRKVLFAL